VKQDQPKEPENQGLFKPWKPRSEPQPQQPKEPEKPKEPAKPKEPEASKQKKPPEGPAKSGEWQKLNPQLPPGNPELERAYDRQKIGKATSEVYNPEELAAYTKMGGLHTEKGEFSMSGSDLLVREAEFLGKDPAQHIKDLQAHAEAITKDSTVWVRVPDKIVGRILEDGRFKNQLETGTTGGSGDTEFRAEIEDKLFGLNNPEPQNRPIYGYLTEHPDGLLKYETGPKRVKDGVAMYGTVSVKLKPDIRPRTTWTGRDSFGAEGETFRGTKAMDNVPFIPSPLEAPSYKSLKPALELISKNSDPRRAKNTAKELNALNFKNASDAVTYNEAQIHGGLSTSDIAEVVFRGKVPNTKTTKALEAANIPWRHVQ
jgi:hypothetical protein